jgi:hypothetical protein
MSSQHFLDNADNCAAMAESAKTEADRNRFLRMEASWRQLAKANDWLEGRIAPVEVEGNHGLAA